MNRTLSRASVAAVWLYQGLWCKLLGGAGRHAEIVASVPVLSVTAAHGLLLAIGAVECSFAVWTISGFRLRAAAAAQTLMLAAMNASGLLWAGRLIADPAAMLLQNFAFALLLWVAAEESGVIHARD